MLEGLTELRATGYSLDDQIIIKRCNWGTVGWKTHRAGSGEGGQSSHAVRRGHCPHPSACSPPGSSLSPVFGVLMNSLAFGDGVSVSFCPVPCQGSGAENSSSSPGVGSRALPDPGKLGRFIIPVSWPWKEPAYVGGTSHDSSLPSWPWLDREAGILENCFRNAQGGQSQRGRHREERSVDALRKPGRKRLEGWK